MKQFLKSRGYTPGRELQALLDPKIAPMLIAANVAHNAGMYERHSISINEEALAYGYNPDISFRRDDSQQRNPLTSDEAKELMKGGIQIDKAMLPSQAVLEKSPHVANIKRWLECLSKSDTE